MNIYVTEAPETVVPHRMLTDRFTPDNGKLLLHLAPSDTSAGAVALTMLQALGKNFRVTGGNTVRTGEHIQYAPIWIAAEGISTVVILDAHRIAANTLQLVKDYAPSARSLILVTEGSVGEVTATRLRQSGLHTTPLNWDTVLSNHPRSPARLLPAPIAYGLDHLPQTDFLVFRQSTAIFNTPGRFEAIDADYRRAYQAATVVPATQAAVINHLSQVTANTTSTAPMLVAIRATQAALLTRGLLLQVHPDRLLAMLSSTRHPRPTAADWQALRAYTRPERAATVALYLLGASANSLHGTLISTVEGALDSGTWNEQPIPAAARPLLTAQLLRRAQEDATESDSYLALNGPRRHLEIIIDARRDLGLPIDGRNLSDDDTSNLTRSLYRIGVQLRDLRDAS